jgi:hypothetical protein
MPTARTYRGEAFRRARHTVVVANQRALGRERRRRCEPKKVLVLISPPDLPISLFNPSDSDQLVALSQARSVAIREPVTSRAVGEWRTDVAGEGAWPGDDTEVSASGPRLGSPLSTCDL